MCEVEVWSPDKGAPEALISLNHNPHALRSAMRSNVPASRRVLIPWEPPVVRPDQYSPRVASHYGVRFAPSWMWANRSAAHAFNWPQGRDPGPSLACLEPRYEAVMLQSNKISAIRGSRYSLRREICMRSAYPIVMAGQGWPTSLERDLRTSAIAFARAIRYKQVPSIMTMARGLMARPPIQETSVDDKIQYLRRFRVVVVVENSSDYVSEKLFDAIFSRRPVIYVGPSLARFGIPPQVAIESAADPAAVSDALTQISDEVEKSMLQAQEAFIQTNALAWDGERVLGELGVAIGRALRGEAHG